MGPALHISGASGGACPSVTTGSGAPDADLAARGEVTLVINGTAVAVPRDRGGNLAGAGVGVGAALPFTFGALSGGATFGNGSGNQPPPPCCLLCITSPDTLFHVELNPGLTRTVVAWELSHTFVLCVSGGGFCSLVVQSFVLSVRRA